MNSSVNCVIFGDIDFRTVAGSEEAAKALFEYIPHAKLSDIAWLPLRALTKTSFPDLVWNDLPCTDTLRFVSCATFSSVERHPRQRHRATIVAGREISTPVVDWETAELFVITGRMCNEDTISIKLHRFFSLLGRFPSKIRIITLGASSQSFSLSWTEIECRAGYHALNQRFRQLYSFNFKCLAPKALKSAVMTQGELEGCPSLEKRLQTASMGGFRVEFLQALYRIRNSERLPLDGSSLDPILHAVHRIRILGRDEWLENAFAGSRRHLSVHAPIETLDDIVLWEGTGRHAPLRGSLSSFVGSGTFQSVVHAMKLGFIRVDQEGDIELTVSGRYFLGLLSPKLEDTDAPIRWNHINDGNAAQSDAWLQKHFRLLKRSISAHRL